ncbi:MAG: glucose-1-phosphate cytidylyltransferase [Pseudomonadota bacterium]|nr:glucose-1-phosphate cytidylyltransferase [Pseudomonadota bacterium]
MKVVILAGGFGTRLIEETTILPKPLIEINSKPILWHIMSIYSHYGYNDFIICCGYKGYLIKEYFYNFRLHNSDLTINLKDNNLEIHSNKTENWRVTLVDSGLDTQTGGRIKAIENYIDGDFFLTYGDGVSNININTLRDFHESHNKLATITTVKPQGRFGSLALDGDNVVDFIEKPLGESGWINGGFFVLKKGIFKYLDGPDTIWEREPLENLASDNQLRAFKHNDFWQPMDSLRDKNYLEGLCKSQTPPWFKFDD